MIAQINPQAQLFNEVFLTVSELGRVINKHVTFREAEDLLESLMERKIDIFDPTTNTRKILRWISSAEFKRNSGVIRFAYDNDLKPYLLGLHERFSSYRLQTVIELKSAYTIRIYELLSSLRHLNHKSRRYKYRDLRDMLGVDDDQYVEWFDFRRWILDPANRELTDKTDLSYTYEEHRVKRKVDAITFRVKFASSTRSVGVAAPAVPNETPELLTPSPDAWKETILERLCSSPFDVHATVARTLLGESEWPQAYWKWALSSAAKQIERKPPQNPGGFTVSYLRSTYGTWLGMQSSRKRREDAAKQDQQRQPEFVMDSPPARDAIIMEDAAASTVWKKVAREVVETSSSRGSNDAERVEIAERLDAVRAVGVTEKELRITFTNMLAKFFVESKYMGAIHACAAPRSVVVVDSSELDQFSAPTPMDMDTISVPAVVKRGRGRPRKVKAAA